MPRVPRERMRQLGKTNRSAQDDAAKGMSEPKRLFQKGKRLTISHAPGLALCINDASGVMLGSNWFGAWTLNASATLALGRAFLESGGMLDVDTHAMSAWDLGVERGNRGPGTWSRISFPHPLALNGTRAPSLILSDSRAVRGSTIRRRFRRRRRVASLSSR